MYATWGMLKGGATGGGGGYPTLVSSAVGGSGSGTSRDFDMPASPVVVAGQLIVHLVALSGGSVSGQPSGYTRIGSLNAWYKTAVGGEEGSSVPFTISSGSANSSEMSLVFSGATQITANNSTGSTANANPASLTVPWGATNNLFLTTYHGLEFTSGADITAFPSNCSLYQLEYGGVGTPHLALAGAETTAATFDPAAWTSTAGSWGLFTLGLAA